MIRSWIHAMEAWFISRNIPDQQKNMIMVTRVATEHLDEVYPYEKLSHEDFKKKLIELFGEADLSQRAQTDLNDIKQAPSETLEHFMNRIKILVNTAYTVVPAEMKDNICVNTFSRGIIDQKTAICALVNVKTPNEAVSVCSKIGIKGATGYRQLAMSSSAAVVCTHLSLQDTGGQVQEQYRGR